MPATRAQNTLLQGFLSQSGWISCSRVVWTMLRGHTTETDRFRRLKVRARTLRAPVVSPCIVNQAATPAGLKHNFSRLFSRVLWHLESCIGCQRTCLQNLVANGQDLRVLELLLLRPALNQTSTAARATTSLTTTPQIL